MANEVSEQPASAVTALEVDAKVLQLFWDLASVDPQVRQAAASALAEHMRDAERTFVPTPTTDEEVKKVGKKVKLDKEDDEEDSDEEKKAALESALGRLAPLSKYMLRRLARGLSSNREGARQGFASALTACLLEASQLGEGRGLPLECGPALLRSCLDPVTGAVKAQEANDGYLGQLFGLGAIIRALNSSRETGSSAGKKKDTTDKNMVTLRVELAEALVSLAAKKVFLRLPAAALVKELLCVLPGKALKQVIVDAPQLSAWLQQEPQEAQPEVLLVLLGVLPQLPQETLSMFPVLPKEISAGGEDLASKLFQREHIGELLSMLKATTSAHPRLHPLWSTLMTLLVPGLKTDRSGQLLKPIRQGAKKDKDKKRKKKGADGDEQEEEESEEPAAASALSPEAETFWSEVVESASSGGLIHSSHDRKFLAFELFELMLPHMKGASVASLFSHHFMQCLVNNLSAKDNYLHAKAQHTAQTIVHLAQAQLHPQARVAVTAALQRFAGGQFDRLTGTETVKSLIASHDTDSAMLHLETLKTAFLEPGEDSEPAVKRSWAVDQMASLWKTQPSGPAGRPLKMAVLSFLLHHAFFQAKEGKKASSSPSPCLPPLTSETRTKCLARLLALLGNASATLLASHHQQQQHQQGKQGEKKKKKKDASDDDKKDNEAVVVDREDLLSDVVNMLIEMENEAPKAKSKWTLKEELDEEAQEARVAAVAAMKEMTRQLSSSSATSALTGHRTRAMAAMTQMLLLVHLGDPFEYTQVLAELPLVLKKGGVIADVDKDGDEDADEDTPNPMDVLVDLLLSILAKSSAALREAAERVFRAWAEDITPTGIKDMMRVLDSGGDRYKARRKGGKKSKDSSGSDDDDDDDDDDGNVFEMEGGDSGGEDEEEVEEEVGQDDDEDDDDDDDNDDDDHEDTGNANKKRKAGKAVEEKKPSSAKKPRGKKEDDEDEDEDEDEEEFMDDEQMFKMDELLGAAFKSARNDRTAAKTTAESLMHFKFRICTLLEIYLKKCPAAEPLPRMILPLLRALSLAHDPPPSGSPQLANRLAKLVTALTRSRAKPANLNSDAAEVALTKVTRLACRSKVKSVASAAGDAAIYLLHILGEEERSSQVMVEMLDAFFVRKDCRLTHKFLEDAMLRKSSRDTQEVHLMPAVARHLASARSDYMRSEAATLLAALARHLAAQGQLAVESKSESASWQSAVGGSLAGAIAHPYQKQAHRAAVFKAACSTLEVLPKLLPAIDARTKALKTTLKSAETLTLPADTPPKVTNQLQRLLTLLGSKQKVRKAALISDAVDSDNKVLSDEDEEEEAEKREIGKGKKESGKGDKGKKRALKHKKSNKESDQDKQNKKRKVSSGGESTKGSTGKVGKK